jgi:hypothetical protein
VKGNISAEQTYYPKTNCVHIFIPNWHLPHIETHCSNYSRTKVKIKMHAIKERVDSAVKLSCIPALDGDEKRTFRSSSFPSGKALLLSTQ